MGAENELPSSNTKNTSSLQHTLIPKVWLGSISLLSAWMLQKMSHSLICNFLVQESCTSCSLQYDQWQNS